MSFYPIDVRAEFSLMAQTQTDDHFSLGEIEDCLLQGWNMTPSEEDPGRWTGNIDLSFRAGEGGSWESRVEKILVHTPSAVMEVQEVEIFNLETSINQSEIERLAQAVAEQLHQSWQEENREVYSVRRKATKDEQWVESSLEGAVTVVIPADARDHFDLDELDIQLQPGQAIILETETGERLGVFVDLINTSYAGLPADWQEANQVSAQGAAELITQSILESGSWDMEKVAEQIHEQWLDNNPWAVGSEQGKPFSGLSHEDQERDRSVARVVASLL